MSQRPVEGSTVDKTEVDAALLAAIDDDETIALLREFISIGTENPPGDESRLARLLALRLGDAGIETELHEVAPGRENLVAYMGPTGGPVLLLNAHTDTMPAGPGWSSPPQAPVVRRGRLYGRGACDVKGGLAACVEVFLALKRAHIALAGQLVLDAVVDEEAGGTGTRFAIGSGRRADAAIVLEPTDLKVVNAGNGQVNFEVEFEGVAAHGSSPEAGHSAIADAAAFVSLVEDEARRLVQQPHPSTGPGSYNVGTICGGVQTSIVPARCRLTVDRRITPGQSVDGAVADLDLLLDTLRATRPGVKARRNVLIAVPSLDIPANDLIVATAVRAATDCGVANAGPGGLRATSDAAQLIAVGVPSIVFGPGSISDSAHRPDEYVPVGELHLSSRILGLAAVRFLGVRG
jgi:acetylornithine deacetylase